MLNNQISPMRQHEISMLLSRQKAEFGINMYEAMTAADDIMIENLVRQGMDVDSAILSIFEQKYARLGGGRSKYVPEPVSHPLILEWCEWKLIAAKTQSLI